MPKIKTSELSGAALDWAVAIALGFTVDEYPKGWRIKCGAGEVIANIWKANFVGLTSQYSPSTNWYQCGSMIHKEGVWLSDDNETEENWIASVGGGNMQYGLTPLIAACRAIVSAHLGDEVDIPEELV